MFRLGYREIGMKGDVTVSLTVKEILEKTFQRSFKGYNEDEVDQFLDQIIDEVKRLSGQVKALEDKNAELSRALEDEKKHRDKIKEAEATIMNTLVSAQKTSDRVLRDAARKAELIIDSAENTAKQRVAQTDTKLQEAEGKLKDIKNSAKAFAAEFTNLINTTAAAFSEKYRTGFDDTPPSGINAAALQKINREVEDGLKDIAPETESEGEREVEDMPVEVQTEDVAETPDNAAEEPVDSIAEETPDNTVEKSIDSAAEELADNAAEEPAAEEPAEEPAADVTEKSADEAEATDIEPDNSSETGSAQKTGLMELHEINKALSELENGEDILPDDGEKEAEKGSNTEAPQFSDYKQKYNDYSWLYESDGQPEAESSIKDPENKDELKSLIDEIID